MELGALICRPMNPQCEVCPVQRHCKAYKDLPSGRQVTFRASTLDSNPWSRSQATQSASKDEKNKNKLSMFVSCVWWKKKVLLLSQTDGT